MSTSVGFSTSSDNSAKEWRLKIEDVAFKNGQKQEVEVEGIEGGKVLLLKVNDQLRALGAKCTHYGAPMVKGVIALDGRITCPWHAACFNTDSGDIENAPAIDHLASFPVSIKNGSAYIIGEESLIKSGRRKPDIRCAPVTAAGSEHVIIVGGGSGSLGAIEGLREKGFKGKITVLSKETYLPIDRTKLSKALIADEKKLQWRDEEHFSSAAVDFHLGTEVQSVDFKTQKVKTNKGEFEFTKILLASGGTPRMLPLKGFKDLGNVFVLRDIGHVKEILEAVGDNGKRIVVVGSSFIGMEVSNCLSKKNDVTVIGLESTPLERIMGAKVGAIFQEQLEKNGVKFKMSASVESAEPSTSDPTKVGAVALKGGEKIEADLVILGVGVAPATDYLKNSGIELEKDGSVQVDDCFRIKGVENAYAVGDIATYPYYGPGSKEGGTLTRVEHWNVAQNSGRQAALHIATKRKPIHFVPTFWSALGAQLRYCGATSNGYDDVVVQGQPDQYKFVAYYTLGDVIVAVATMQKDPIMTQCAELMRRKMMPSKTDILGGVDVLQVEVPAGVRI
ncbi:Apoptosis-inducing factor 1 [Rhizina undulata]